MRTYPPPEPLSTKIKRYQQEIEADAEKLDQEAYEADKLLQEIGNIAEELEHERDNNDPRAVEALLTELIMKKEAIKMLERDSGKLSGNIFGKTEFLEKYKSPTAYNPGKYHADAATIIHMRIEIVEYQAIIIAAVQKAESEAAKIEMLTQRLKTVVEEGKFSEAKSLMSQIKKAYKEIKKAKEAAKDATENLSITVDECDEERRLRWLKYNGGDDEESSKVDFDKMKAEVEKVVRKVEKADYGSEIKKAAKIAEKSLKAAEKAMARVPEDTSKYSSAPLRAKIRTATPSLSDSDEEGPTSDNDPEARRIRDLTRR